LSHADQKIQTLLQQQREVELANEALKILEEIENEENQLNTELGEKISQTLENLSHADQTIQTLLQQQREVELANKALKIQEEIENEENQLNTELALLEEQLAMELSNEALKIQEEIEEIKNEQNQLNTEVEEKISKILEKLSDADQKIQTLLKILSDDENMSETKESTDDYGDINQETRQNDEPSGFGMV